jgi:hypothetical protein
VILMLGYPDVYEAADHVPDIDPFGPTALEGIDYRLYQNIAKKGGPHKKYLSMLPEGKGWLLAEFGADKRQDAIDLARQVMSALEKNAGSPSMKLFTDPEQMQHIWEVRESGLGATAFVPTPGPGGKIPRSRRRDWAAICETCARCFRSTVTTPLFTVTLVRAASIVAWTSVSPAAMESASGACFSMRRPIFARSTAAA